jgi:chaperonin GroEL
LENLELEGDEKVGASIVRRAIEAPLKPALHQRGRGRARGRGPVKERSKGNIGYNVATGAYEDLVKAGVVDPTKVTRTALQNAASIAGLLLTTECMITELPEKKDAAPAGGPGGGMGGMDY